MADEQMGLFRALWRFVTFYGLRKQLGLVRAADRMFTGSTEGIGDAFDLHRDQLIRRYNDLFDAFGQLETVLEEKRLDRYRRRAEELQTLIAQLNELETALETTYLEVVDLVGQEASAGLFESGAAAHLERAVAAARRVEQRLRGFGSADTRADEEYLEV